MMRRLLVLSAFMLGGCMPPGVLVAKTGEHRLIARDGNTGITIVLTTAAWDGEPADLESSFTVVHALVSNMGQRPILLAPGDLELVSLRGFRYDLLDAGGSFHRQPAAAQSQPTLGSYDPGGDIEYGVIRGGSLSAAALPWGVLEPGTQMRGFVYFEKVENSANQARLVWHIRAPDHTPVADFAFDLYVARPRA